MKKLKPIGTVLSREELKQINGGLGQFVCSCFDGPIGSPPLNLFVTSNPIFSICPSGSTRINCTPIPQE